MTKKELHNYQTSIPHNKKGLFWKMGLGKTFAGLYFASKRKDKILIICLERLIKQWELAVAEYRGIIDKDLTKDIIVCNIEKLMNGSLKLPSISYLSNNVFVVVDESHLLFKSHKSQRTKWFVKNISTQIKDNIILLSGTPIKKDETDMFSQHLIANEFFIDELGNKILKYSQFVNTFMLTRNIKLHNGRQFQEIISLNPQKEDLFYTQFYKFWDFKDSQEYRYNYEKILIEPDKKFLDMQENIRGGLLKLENIEEPLTHLGQALTRYDQISDGFIYLNNKEKDYEIVNELKLDVLFNIIIYEQGEYFKKVENNIPRESVKILVFCKFIASRKLIYDYCIENNWYKYGINPFLYEKNYLTIENFKNQKKGINILISSQKLMATGFNLQEANIIIFYSSDGDYATKQQAISRIARQGQEKECFVYDLIINSSFKTEIIENSIAFSKDKSSSDERTLKRLLKKEKKIDNLKNYFINLKN